MANPNKKPLQWIEFAKAELLAYCGLLLVIGAFRSNSERIVDLWNCNSYPLYRVTMYAQSIQRNLTISTFR